MSARTVITVDGLAATGKSSLAAALAERLGYIHLNTGRAYRAAGYLALTHGIDRNDEAKSAELVRRYRIELLVNGAGFADVAINGEVMGDRLDGREVSESTSLVSRHKGVRDALLDVQRHAFPDSSVVAEGRDMGTVVFPDAPLKFFIEAPAEVRIERRLRQRGLDPAHGGSEVDRQKTILMEILERDRRDSERAVAPTVAAPDAVVITNAGRTLTEVVDFMYSTALSRGLKPVTLSC